MSNLREYISYCAIQGGFHVKYLENAVLVLSGREDNYIFSYLFPLSDSELYDIEIGKRAIDICNTKKHEISVPLEAPRDIRNKYQYELGLSSPGFPKKALLTMENFVLPPKNNRFQNLTFVPVCNKATLSSLDILTSLIFDHDFGIVMDSLRCTLTENFDESPLKIFLIKDEHGVYIGCCAMFISGETAGFYIDGVLPEYRKKGVGSAMLQKRIELAIQYGCKYILAHCMRASLSIYKRFGFEMIGEFPICGFIPDSFN